MKTKDAYTELAIQIAQLTAKVDKLLELAMKNQQQQWTVINPTIQGEGRIMPIPKAWKDGIAYCGAALSDDEIFLEENK